VVKQDLSPVEAYLKGLSEIHRMGVATPETSYYPVFERLITDVIKLIKHPSKCIMNPANVGSGNPDGGIYRKSHSRDKVLAEPLPGLKPEYGAIEIKPVSDSAWTTAESSQVSRYWSGYRKVLVSNFREFILVDDRGGRPNKVDSFSFSTSESGFWEACKHYKKTTEEKGALFIEFLKRAVLHETRIAEPKDLAMYLASYARDALDRLRIADEKDVASVRQAMESTLGMRFQGKAGDDLFHSSLVQTLFYGIFSAYVLWSSTVSATDEEAHFSWKESGYYLNIPILETLYSALSARGKLASLNLLGLLDRVGETLNRVSRKDFFQKFSREEAIQYFYEPFLEAYHPQLRKEYGVWYTPPEIVKYMVERVDMVLRTELGIAKGLADEDVYVLDPCCGTGAFLVEVIRRIGKTLSSGRGKALAGEKLKKAATERIFGFEIMLAPLVISHMQINLELEAQQAKLFPEAKERPCVYLTNALTDWGPPPKISSENGYQYLVHEFAEERKAANRIKRDKPILVVLGNPPYNAFAGLSPEEEEGLVEVYKGPYIEGSKDIFGETIPKKHKQRKYWLNTPESKGGWGIKKFNLDDLYIRFFRIAERRVAEMTGKGVMCFISNYSWTEKPSFVIMREHFLESFDRVWIENMHGNRKITEYAPDGRTSQTVFAIRGHSPGIRQGIVISLALKSGKEHGEKKILYRNDIDEANADERRAHLLKTLKVKSPDDFDSKYDLANPAKENRYSFRPMKASVNYLTWPKLNELSLISPINGVMEKRKGSLMDIDKQHLEIRMRAYFNPHIGIESLGLLAPGLALNTASFDAVKTRNAAIQSGGFTSNAIRKLSIRPFDVIWCYYTLEPSVWNRSRPKIAPLLVQGNSFIVTRKYSGKFPEGAPISHTTALIDAQMLGYASCIPHFTINDSKESVLTPNLSEIAVAYLGNIGIKLAAPPYLGLTDIWLHALAIGYSPLYLSENADGIRQDWPRIPLPDSDKLLRDSARYGSKIADMLDTEKAPVYGLDPPSDEQVALFDNIADITAINPKLKRLSEAEGHFELSAGWGYKSKGRNETEIVMPGSGRIERRAYSDDEMARFEAAAPKYGLTRESLVELLGKETCDVYLNGFAYWRNIPVRIWEYYIGGYQVIKKWLSYREKGVLGRSLTIKEVEYVSEIARRLAFLRVLEPRLDANYLAIKANCYKWPTG